MARDELASGRKLTAAARAFLKKSPGLTTDAELDRLHDYTTQLETEETAMPPKGTRAMGEDREMVSVRLPRSTVAKIDAHVRRLQRENPDLPINRVHALNNLIRRASEVIEAEVTDTVTDTPAAQGETAAAMHDATAAAIAAIERAIGHPLGQADVTGTAVTDTVTDTPALPVVTESKTARPKAAAKRKTTRATKGRT